MSERERCGYATEDADGEMEPCDRPATGWRWYQDVGEHEDMLDEACDWHANEGGRLIHSLQADLADEKRRHAPWSLCTGAGDCPEAWHIHGCYADEGQCSDPLDHDDEYRSLATTEPQQTPGEPT